jgi:ABC-type nitrate/sulfonate/bicarbonate transport system ATPase subunit
VLLSLTGASGVGKSTALDAIADAFEGQPVS